MSGNVQAPLRTVAVFGSGPVALSAAIAFARSLPRTTVALIATPADPAALADRLPATLPSSAQVLDLIGLDERELIIRDVATHRLAERFIDWNGTRTDWLHAQGEGAPPLLGGALYKLWCAFHEPGCLPFHAYTPGGALAARDRFVHPRDGDPLLARHDYALRLDPELLVPLMIEQAHRAGVQIMRGRIAGVTRDDRNVTSVRVEGSGSVAADLLVDATGPASPIAGALDDRREDWRPFLPCDRLLLADDRASPSPVDAYRALSVGWRARWPLAGRTIQGLGWCSALTSDARARRVFGAGGEQAELLAFALGRRRSAWTGNVLALGDAAVSTGPLGWTGLALAHAHLELALELLPGRNMEPLLLAEYNRRAGVRADRLRDFLAAHYMTGTHSSGEFWRALRGHALPPGLDQTSRQFAQRGLLPHADEDSVSQASWVSVLLGQGVRPRRPDPIAHSISPDQAKQSLAAIHGALARLADRLPPYPDYLARMAGAHR